MNEEIRQIQKEKEKKYQMGTAQINELGSYLTKLESTIPIYNQMASKGIMNREDTMKSVHVKAKELASIFKF